jgi:hypothetical protein
METTNAAVTPERDANLDGENLRAALAECEIQRDAYRGALVQELRASREFEKLDIPTLEAISAGPVELVQ